MNSLLLGSLCLLLEDIGFEERRPSPNYLKDMTYYFYSQILYGKIFADIDKIWVLEFCLVPEELHIDRWEKKRNGLFIVDNCADIVMSDPKSLNKITSFVNESIIIASDNHFTDA